MGFSYAKAFGPSATIYSSQAPRIEASLKRRLLESHSWGHLMVEIQQPYESDRRIVVPAISAPAYPDTRGDLIRLRNLLPPIYQVNYQ